MIKKIWNLLMTYLNYLERRSKMRIKNVKDNEGGNVVLFSETTNKDYLYNSPLNLVKDLQPDSEYVKNIMYSKIKSKFFSTDVMCFADIQN